MTGPRRAYTLLEMLTTIAALVIVLGLMVSLARHVRSTEAERLTRDVCQRLDQAMAQYIREHNAGKTPVVPALLAKGADEARLADTAAANNQAVVELLRKAAAPADSPLADLQAAVYDGHSVRDAWGSPIVFMPTGDQAVSIAPNNRWFFVSAGPDQRYLTTLDNINSYQQGTGSPPPLSEHGGHDE